MKLCKDVFCVKFHKNNDLETTGIEVYEYLKNTNLITISISYNLILTPDWIRPQKLRKKKTFRTTLIEDKKITKNADGIRRMIVLHVVSDSQTVISQPKTTTQYRAL